MIVIETFQRGCSPRYQPAATPSATIVGPASANLHNFGIGMAKEFQRRIFILVGQTELSQVFCHTVQGRW